MPADRSSQRRPARLDPRGAYAAFDCLATFVAVVDRDGTIVFANAALEDALGVSRRLIEGTAVTTWFGEPAPIMQALDGLERDAFAALRYEAQLRRPERGALPVHVIASRAEPPYHAVIELVSLEAQVRKDREERLADQAAANKELVRNLAHEIKNPLGGIRGAAQLLDLELNSAALRDYTQVIVHEADRLQALVDRLLAPHRAPHVVTDVNIHEVCERVRTLVLAEFAEGLRIERDYDTSIPEFRGDREQLIQALLNVVQNAAQALAARRQQGDALIILRTRVVRQVTLGTQRHRLALELHVIDNGPGIAASIKDRIFLPLVSGREGGSGLGLTLAQTFIQRHHGLIECDSVPGHTDFKIVIPLP